MNSASKHAAIALLVIGLSGCPANKTNTTPPAQAQAPSAPPTTADSTPTGKAGAMYPPPLTQTETPTQQAAPVTPPPTVVVQPPPPLPQPAPADTKKSTSRKSKSSAQKGATTQPASATDSSTATTSTTTPPAPEKTTDVASGATPTATGVAEPAAASPIGQLTTGDVAGQAQKGKETSDLIANTESGLNAAMKRTLNPQEQETANQIKTFLNKAKLALGNEDVDGAQILATKAKVLLDELNKS